MVTGEGRKMGISTRLLSPIGLLLWCAAVSAPAAQAQITPYYIAAGDQDLVTIVQNGVLVGTFDSSPSNRGYPIAIRNTVWLGERDDTLAAEYTLAGVSTGNTSVGGGNFSELLDGTTDGVFNNFGVEFGAGAVGNFVTVANLDWSGQAILFPIPFDADGIAFDTTTGNLFISDAFNNNLYEYSLEGILLNTFTPNVNTVSLAYEQATDTLWSATNGGNTIYQFSKTGVVLQTLVIAGADFRNNYGGEMPILAAASAAAPEPATLALLATGLLPLVGAMVRRRRTR